MREQPGVFKKSVSKSGSEVYADENLNAYYASRIGRTD